MSQRVLNALMLCVALLFAGAPAFVCSLRTSSGDCCDPDGKLPCGNGQQQSTRISCCMEGETQVVQAALATDELKQVERIADPPLASNSLVTRSPDLIGLNFASPSRSILQLGSLTYLKTGRLRL